MMGLNYFMLAKTHLFDQTDIPMMFQDSITEYERDPVIIGDDVWIDRNVIIISTFEIGTGSIISAICVQKSPSLNIVLLEETHLNLLEVEYEETSNNCS